ncbi:MAG: DNA-3-methyladenine glycosylase I [Bryobacterales bacterium]|nr:DNA-3-methyladenine glycosylase I [Bryobacterales bacterium]
MEPSDPHASAVPGLVCGKDGLTRCFWGSKHPDYATYHDREWGLPVADDRLLFEKICLEGFQSGLSWLTILRKRESFREAFCGFDFERIADYSEQEVGRLLANPGIVRHRGKIEATINNARRAREMASQYGSLAAFFWQWEPKTSARPGRLDYSTLLTLASSPESTSMSRALKRRGWRFVGPTTAYAFMQAMGMVNDHIEGCHARPRVEERRRLFIRPASVASSRRTPPGDVTRTN